MPLIKYEGETWTAADEPIPEFQAEAGEHLLLSVDDEPTAAHTSAAAIAIEFPAFNDGRGLSSAVLLRRLGYTGPLYAVGEVHPDIAHYMVRCGFSHLVLPERFSSAEALAIVSPYSAHYQGSALDPTPRFRRVS